MYPKYIINKRPEFENLWLFDGLDSSIVIIAKKQNKDGKDNASVNSDYQASNGSSPQA
jgi:ABC-type uncharacterized transport system substrate-binding protein